MRQDIEETTSEDMTRATITSDLSVAHDGTNSAPGSEISQPSQMNMMEPLPGLHTPHKRRKMIMWTGVGLAVLDLCILPITYYYALRFDTKLSMQEIFGIITGVYGLISFSHYSLRSLKLFRKKYGEKWKPIGWTRWGLMEFLQVNLLIVITLFEIELVVGTIPDDPWIRLVAMPSPTICFYFGFLFCGSAILTQLKQPLPFNMSSVEKGTPWRPALHAFVEDVGAIEANGGVEYRKQVLRRYEVSPRFRRMLLILTWAWGVGLICVAIASTVLIMLLPKEVGFGIGWSLPWAFSAVLSVLTAVYIKSQLNKEKEEWLSKGGTIS